MTTLYQVDNKGQLRSWEILANEEGLTITHGIIDGQKVVKHHTIPRGKAARSRADQIASEVRSRINKQRDKGYSESIMEAQLGTTNMLGLKKPMLAQKDILPRNFMQAFVQRKYDGNRCLITKQGGRVIAYSRNGKPIDSIDHITTGLILREGETIDGELYCHGERLQTIASWVKRKQEDTLKLKYHAYDMVSNEPFIERYSKLYDVRGKIEIVPTIRINNLATAFEYFDQFRVEGYEGAIIRWGLEGYEDGKRSKHLIKLKSWLDDEFVVVDILPSTDGWARLVCTIPGDKYFTVTAPGTVVEKENVLINKERYIGKVITVEYAYLTEDGIPFHPIAKCWKD